MGSISGNLNWLRFVLIQGRVEKYKNGGRGGLLFLKLKKKCFLFFFWGYLSKIIKLLMVGGSRPPSLFLKKKIGLGIQNELSPAV